MSRYVLRHFLLLIPVVFTTSVIIFLVLRLDTSNPALDCLRLPNLPPTPKVLVSIRTMLGPDQSPYAQYDTWLWKTLHLDFDVSFANQHPMPGDMLSFPPATLELTGAALILVLLTSVSLSTWATCHRDCLPNFIVRLIASLGVSVPSLWLAFPLMVVFSVCLQWLPAMGYGSWQHIILPAVPIAFTLLTINARLLRVSILDTTGQRHVTWARLHGLGGKQVECRHILRNTSLPMITAVGTHTGKLTGGTMAIGSIPAWPGVERYTVSTIFNHGCPVIRCFTLVVVVVLVICNLITDLLSAALGSCIRRYKGTHA